MFFPNISNPLNPDLRIRWKINILSIVLSQSLSPNHVTILKVSGWCGSHAEPPVRHWRLQRAGAAQHRRGVRRGVQEVEQGGLDEL